MDSHLVALLAAKRLNLAPDRLNQVSNIDELGVDRILQESELRVQSFWAVLEADGDY